MRRHLTALCILVCTYENGQLIGYGRLIGDLTIFIYVQDVMVVPEYQVKAVGTGIMMQIVNKIKELKEHSPTLKVYFGALKTKKSSIRDLGLLLDRKQIWVKECFGFRK